MRMFESKFRDGQIMAPVYSKTYFYRRELIKIRISPGARIPLSVSTKCVFTNHAASPFCFPRAEIFKFTERMESKGEGEREREKPHVRRSFFFRSCRNRRALDRTRATGSSSRSRNYSDSARSSRHGRAKSGVLCVFPSFPRPAPPAHGAARRLIPAHPFARTQNRIHARKILCRIRRSWRGATIDGDAGVWKVYPAKELSVAEARCAPPRNFPLYK